MTSDPPLSTTLRRVRLAERIRRLDLVVAALDTRAREFERLDQPVPRALRHSMGSFREELGVARRRLRDSSRNPDLVESDGSRTSPSRSRRPTPRSA